RGHGESVWRWARFGTDRRRADHGRNCRAIACEAFAAESWRGARGGFIKIKMEIKIPLSKPDVRESDIAAVADVLRQPRLSMGPRQEEFERLFADYIGASSAVAVNSGTSGLHIALLALGVGPGDEVIVPSFSFIAPANAITYAHATPIFAE